MAKRPTEDERDFDARLKNARQQAGLDKPPNAPPPPLGLASYALRLSTELVAGILVGGALGWAIDRSAHTSPLGIIVCLLLGFLGGMLNVMRAVKRLNKQQADSAPVAAPATEDEYDDDEDN